MTESRTAVEILRDVAEGGKSSQITSEVARELWDIINNMNWELVEYDRAAEVWGVE